MRPAESCGSSSRAGLDLLPYEPVGVRTPVGRGYDGLRIAVPYCGVSIARAGDSLEAALREVDGEVRMCKMLIQRDKQTKLPQLYFVALPHDVAQRHVLLLDPMLATGGTAYAAIDVLRDEASPRITSCSSR